MKNIEMKNIENKNALSDIEMETVTGGKIWHGIPPLDPLDPLNVSRPLPFPQDRRPLPFPQNRRPFLSNETR